MDASGHSFDAGYAIEATIRAPNNAGAYGEVFRVLMPGGVCATYEYCLTHRFDLDNPSHQRLKAGLEIGGPLPDIAYPHQVNTALQQVGFELLEARDLAVKPGPGIPWHQPLAGSRFSLTTLRSSKAGRMASHGTLRILEALRIVPKGILHVARLLDICAVAMVASGRLGIFTPMHFVLARKPGQRGDRCR